MLQSPDSIEGPIETHAQILFYCIKPGSDLFAPLRSDLRE